MDEHHPSYVLYAERHLISGFELSVCTRSFFVKLNNLWTNLFAARVIYLIIDMGAEWIFSRGATRGFFLNFPRGPKVVKFHFSHSKLRKQPFLLKISQSRGLGPLSPLPTPMVIDCSSFLSRHFVDEHETWFNPRIQKFHKNICFYRDNKQYWKKFFFSKTIHKIRKKGEHHSYWKYFVFFEKTHTRE